MAHYTIYGKDRSKNLEVIRDFFKIHTFTDMLICSTKFLEVEGILRHYHSNLEINLTIDSDFTSFVNSGIASVSFHNILYALIRIYAKHYAG